VLVQASLLIAFRRDRLLLFHKDQIMQDPTTYKTEIDGYQYTIRKNKRIRWANFYTIMRDGKPFATIRYDAKDGWSGSYNVSRFYRMTWMMSANTSLEERVQKMHDGWEEARSRFVFVQ